MDVKAIRTIVIRYEQVDGKFTFTAEFVDNPLLDSADAPGRSVGETPWKAVENLYIGTAAIESFLEH